MTNDQWRMVNGGDSMTRLQSPIAGVAVCVLMVCAAAAVGQEASTVQQTAAEKDAPRLRSSADPSCAAVPASCPPRPLPLARSSLPAATRIEHLLQAALHLEAAGESQRAAEVRKLAASEGQRTPGCTARNESVASALSSSPRRANHRHRQRQAHELSLGRTSASRPAGTRWFCDTRNRRRWHPG